MLSTKIPLRFFVETVLPNHKYIAVRRKNGLRAGVNCKYVLLRLKKEIPLNHNYDLNGVTDLISWSPIQLQEYISIKLPN